MKKTHAIPGDFLFVSSFSFGDVCVRVRVRVYPGRVVYLEGAMDNQVSKNLSCFLS